MSTWTPIAGIGTERAATHDVTGLDAEKENRTSSFHASADCPACLRGRNRKEWRWPSRCMLAFKR